jgi:hypothetical protein
LARTKNSWGRPITAQDLRRTVTLVNITTFSPIAILVFLISLNNSTNLSSWLIVLAVVGVFFIFTIYGYSEFKRIEFFEEFVRVYLGRKRTIDVAYSELELGFDKKKSIGLRSFKLLLKNNKISCTVYDTRIRSLKITLFAWLRTKVRGRQPYD